MKNWCVYLLECSDGSYYCGITNNLNKRLDAHDSGKGAKYTRGRRPLKLLAFRPYLSRSQAAKLEVEVKKRPRDKKVFL